MLPHLRAGVVVLRVLLPLVVLGDDVEKPQKLQDVVQRTRLVRRQHRRSIALAERGRERRQIFRQTDTKTDRYIDGQMRRQIQREL